MFSAITKFYSYDFFCALTHLGLSFNYLVNHYVVDLRCVKQAFIYSTLCFYPGPHLSYIKMIFEAALIGIGPWGQKHQLLMPSVLMCPRTCELGIIMGNITQDTWPPLIPSLPLSKEWPHLYL